MFGHELQNMYRGLEDSKRDYQRKFYECNQKIINAAYHNDVAAIRLMPNIPVSMQFEVYQSGMLTAIQAQSLEVVDLLLKKMGTVNCDVLHCAHQNGLLDKVFYRADDNSKQRFLNSLSIAERVHVRHEFELQ